MRDFNIDIIISNSDHDKLEQFCSLFNLKSFIKKRDLHYKAAYVNYRFNYKKQTTVFSK